MFIVVNALSYTLKLKEIKQISKINIVGLKFSTGGGKTSWLFTSMTEELTKGLQRNNSNLMVRAGLEPAISALQVRRHNRSATLSPRVCLGELQSLGQSITVDIRNSHTAQNDMEYFTYCLSFPKRKINRTFEKMLSYRLPELTLLKLKVV